jgi:non-specific serine/threonine protein kinase
MATQPALTASHVFLSYASADRERALQIADLLEARGVAVWIDRKSIAGGTSWSAEIVRGIRDCSVFLVACSPAAMASPNVQQEVQLAFETRRPILPLLLAPTGLPDAVRYALTGRQWIELGERVEAEWLPRLIGAIRAVAVASHSDRPALSTPADRAGAAAASATAPHNLPAPVTSFIGRERELAEVKEQLRSTRLLTLIGTGGCGKTRLALEVAGNLVDQYSEGVWLAELAPLTDPGLVPTAVATAIGVPEQPGQAIQSALLSYLRPRRLLLVLDNCEHLIDACAQLVSQILRGCPEVQILATSRELLGISGEQSWRVPPLGMMASDQPADPEALLTNDAVRLFADRARAVQPSFVLAKHNVATVAQICQRLDGIPLAIELAAGRMKSLSVEQIAGRLDQRFRLLTGGSRTALPRQQTLAALVRWSYDLLTAAEQTLFNRLSVFAGGWTLEAAEMVCSDDNADGGPEAKVKIQREDVLNLLSELVDKSLVVAEAATGGAERYRLLETLRQFAREQLSASGEAEEIHSRHAGFYRDLVLQMATQLSGQRMSGPGKLLVVPPGATAPSQVAPSSMTNAERMGAVYRDRMRQESDNLQASLRWYVEIGDVEPAIGLVNTIPESLYFPWDVDELIAWFSRLLALAPEATSTEARVGALVRAAYLLKSRGERNASSRFRDEALALAQARCTPAFFAEMQAILGLWFVQPDYSVGDLTAAVGVLRTLGDPAPLSFGLLSLSRCYYRAGQVDRARDCAAEGLAKARQWGSPHRIAFGLEILGQVATVTDRVEARQYLTESGSIYRQIGDRWGIVSTENFLGRAALLDADLDRATEHYRNALAVIRRWRLLERIIQALDGLAAIAAAREQSVRALRLASASARERLTRVEYYPAIEVAEVEPLLGRARARLGEADAARAWSDGLSLTLDEAIAEALEGA